MTTVYPLSNGYFQQDNALFYKLRSSQTGFSELDNELTLLQSSPESTGIIATEDLWEAAEKGSSILDVQMINLQQLCVLLSLC